MKQQNGFIDPAITLISVGVIVVGAVIFVGGPQYNVWQQSLAGKAELQKAEYTRQVAVLEAQAKKDSAQQLADAGIIRATGVAKQTKLSVIVSKIIVSIFSICISPDLKMVARMVM